MFEIAINSKNLKENTKVWLSLKKAVLQKCIILLAKEPSDAICHFEALKRIADTYKTRVLLLIKYW